MTLNQKRHNWVVPAALMLNLILCGSHTAFLTIDAILSRSAFTPFAFGKYTLPAFLRHWPLLWPCTAAVFGLFGLWRHRVSQFISFFAGMTFFAAMTYFTFSLLFDELEQGRNGGAIPVSIILGGLALLNLVALVAMLRERK